MFTVLEVYQFARDAAVAEAWLMAQEPYLLNQDLGVSTQLVLIRDLIMYFHWIATCTCEDLFT